MPQKRNVAQRACQVGAILSLSGVFGNFVSLNFLFVSSYVQDSYVTTLANNFVMSVFVSRI
jgi:hypothetical protein